VNIAVDRFLKSVCNKFASQGSRNHRANWRRRRRRRADQGHRDSDPPVRAPYPSSRLSLLSCRDPHRSSLARTYLRPLERPAPLMRSSFRVLVDATCAWRGCSHWHGLCRTQRREPEAS